MECVTITSTSYQTGYYGFSLSLACFGDYLQQVTTRYRQLFKKIFIYIFFTNLTGMRGKPLEIAPKQC